MKKLLLMSGLTIGLLMGSTNVDAQTRYMDEVFTDADIVITKDITYGLNVDYMKNLQMLDPAYLQANVVQISGEMQMLKDSFQMGGSFNSSHFFPISLDTNTKVKISEMKMDVYEPDIQNDTVSQRPVILYVHTGNFLPTGINGGPAGSKEDSAAVEFCKQWAKRGYVAVAANYRAGWNPTATGPSGEIVRRATLLNAVYRSIHDMKQVVRVLRYDANVGGNSYDIDASSIALFGQGSGGYVALAYNTLDKSSEMALPKFTDPVSGQSFINEAVVGGIEGDDGLLNMYFDLGVGTDIQACINAGGALADISWLEGNIEAPMISIHAIRDAFAPFDTGTVIVPTTNENVVDVNGPNMFIPKANALGVNDSFKDIFLADPYSNAAKSRYGKTFNNIPSINVNDPVVIDNNAEGLFAIDFDLGNGSPWEWWSLTDLQALEAFYASIGITISATDIHNNALLSNPTMSKSQALTYIDTIQGYIHPRIMRAMQIGEWEPLSVSEATVENNIKLMPNPANNQVTIQSKNGEMIKNITMYDVAGRLVKNEISNLNAVRLNVSDLPSGVYFVNVTTNNSEYVTKLMVE